MRNRRHFKKLPKGGEALVPATLEPMEDPNNPAEPTVEQPAGAVESAVAKAGQERAQPRTRSEHARAEWESLSPHSAPVSGPGPHPGEREQPGSGAGADQAICLQPDMVTKWRAASSRGIGPALLTAQSKVSYRLVDALDTLQCVRRRG